MRPCILAENQPRACAHPSTCTVRRLQGDRCCSACLARCGHPYGLQPCQLSNALAYPSAHAVPCRDALCCAALCAQTRRPLLQRSRAPAWSSAGATTWRRQGAGVAAGRGMCLRKGPCTTAAQRARCKLRCRCALLHMQAALRARACPHARGAAGVRLSVPPGPTPMHVVQPQSLIPCLVDQRLHSSMRCAAHTHVSHKCHCHHHHQPPPPQQQLAVCRAPCRRHGAAHVAGQSPALTSRTRTCRPA